MTPDQKDMLQTLYDHGGSVGAVSYRLTFDPELQKWARDKGLVIRARGKFQLTVSGASALSETKAANARIQRNSDGGSMPVTSKER